MQVGTSDTVIKSWPLQQTCNRCKRVYFVSSPLSIITRGVWTDEIVLTNWWSDEIVVEMMFSLWILIIGEMKHNEIVVKMMVEIMVSLWILIIGEMKHYKIVVKMMVEIMDSLWIL